MLLRSFLITFCASASVWASANAAFALVPGKSSAPGDGVCSDCHNLPTNQLNTGPGRVEIRMADSTATYTPGVAKRVVVAIDDPVARRWGFQLSARVASDPRRQAGSLRTVDLNTVILCSDGTLRDTEAGGTCPQTGPVEFIAHTSRGTRQGTANSVTFEFDWIPPGSDVGEVAFYVSANAANNNGNNQGDRIYTTSTRIAFRAGNSPSPVFPAEGVVNAASFVSQRGMSEGSFFSIFGSNLAPSVSSWDNSFVSGLAPTFLGGVRVFINDRAAFLSLVAPGQINGIVPAGIASGPVTVVVEVNGIRSGVATVEAAALAPALFTFSPRNSRYVAGTTGDGSAFLGPSDLFGGPVNGKPVRAVRSNEVITLYGTGFGATDPGTEIGRVPVGAASLARSVQFRIGNVVVTPQYAGRSGFVGVYQFNVRVPQLANGDHEVLATIQGVTTISGRFLAVQN
jgi:uncharacterized protein (TIGR03437 family)